MTQDECLRYLEKVGCWKSTKDIINYLKKGRSSISISLRKLFERGDIDRKERSVGCHYCYFWRVK